MSFRAAIDRMRAEATTPRICYGPETLHGMSVLFEEYRRCLKLAEYHRAGRNPIFPGNAGNIMGDRLQARADRLADSFPQFPEALKRMEQSK